MKETIGKKKMYLFVIVLVVAVVGIALLFGARHDVDAVDGVSRGGQTVEETVEDAGDSLEEGANDAGRAVEDAVD